MSASSDRVLFLKWLLLNALALVGFVALGVTEHGKVHGASRVAIPIILAVFAWASYGAGRICWAAGGLGEKAWIDGGRGDWEELLHDANWLSYWAYACQILGILSTVYGFWTLLAAGGSTADLGSRIQSGGGVALLGTFVGVLTSLVLTFEHRLIEHELA